MPDINQGIEDISPARRLFMPQQVLEPILHQRAVELGAQFQYGTECVSFDQDEGRRECPGAQHRHQS